MQYNSHRQNTCLLSTAHVEINFTWYSHYNHNEGETERRGWKEKTMGFNVMQLYLCDVHDFDSSHLACLDMTTLVGNMKDKLRPWQTNHQQVHFFKESYWIVNWTFQRQHHNRHRLSHMTAPQQKIDIHQNQFVLRVYATICVQKAKNLQIKSQICVKLWMASSPETLQWKPALKIGWAISCRNAFLSPVPFPEMKWFNRQPAEIESESCKAQSGEKRKIENLVMCLKADKILE